MPILSLAEQERRAEIEKRILHAKEMIARYHEAMEKFGDSERQRIQFRLQEWEYALLCAQADLAGEPHPPDPSRVAPDVAL